MLETFSISWTGNNFISTLIIWEGFNSFTNIESHFWKYYSMLIATNHFPEKKILITFNLWLSTV